MAIFEFLRSLATKKQTTPEKWLDSSVRIVTAGQQGAQKPPFSHERAVNLFRSWVYAAASINANAVASTPLRLYAKKGAGKKLFRTRGVSRVRKSYMLGDGPGDQRPSMSVLRKVADFGDELEEVTESHPIIELLSTCNPFLNGFDSTVLRVLYGELTGNAYLHPVIDEATGMPAELWPLAPQYTEVIPDEESFIRGYLYGVDASKKQVFQRDEVIHFRRPNPGNLYYGLGKIEAAYGAVLSNQAVHDMDLATFQNSARPDYAVVVRGTPTSDQLDRFQEQVEQRLRGTRKDGNFIAVTGDVQFTPLNFPPKDIVGREDIVEEIAAVFGVPVTMLKSNDPNLASSKTGFAQWREGTVLPLIRMDEEELNQTLLPLFGLEDELVLCYDNPVPSDKAYELQERQAAVSGGWRTPNEARLEEGKDPIEDNEYADQLLINGQPLGAAAQQQAPGGVGGFPFMDQVFGGGERGGSMSPAEPTEPGPDVEFASKILGAVRTRSLAKYSAIKLIQGAGFSRAVAEKMVDAEDDTAPQTKVERREGESLDACVARGIETLMGEGYEREQAIAMAFQMCGQKAMNLDESEDKCPGDDCDECGHSEKPRPKAFWLRPTLDGASTEAIVKAWDRWGLIVKDQPDDCGTGAGGFKEDNTCATGAPANEKPAKTGRSYEQADRDQVAKWKEQGKEDREEYIEYQGEFNYRRLDGEQRRMLANMFADLDAEGRKQLLKDLGSKPLDPKYIGFHPSQDEDWFFNFGLDVDGMTPEERWTEQDKILGDSSHLMMRRWQEQGRLEQNTQALWLESMVRDAALYEYNNNKEFYDSLGFGTDGNKERYITSKMLLDLVPVSEAQAKTARDFLASAQTDSGIKLADFEKSAIIDGRPKDAAFLSYEAFDAMDEEWQTQAVNSWEAANRLREFYRKGDHAEGGTMMPFDQLRHSMKLSTEFERHFDERGVRVYVDPGLFITRSDGHLQKRTELRDLTRGFQELAALEAALDVAEKNGHDITGLSFQVIRREDANTSAYEWGGLSATGSFEPISVGGWWSNNLSMITLPADRHQEFQSESASDIEDKRAWGVTARSNDFGTAVHEIGHALHSRNMDFWGRSGLGKKGRARLGESLLQGREFEFYEKSEFVGHLWPRYASSIEKRISGYAATSPVEFVAESFTLKTMYPDEWASIKDQKPYTKAELPKDAFDPSDEFYHTDHGAPLWDQDEVENLTIEELYERLGGV